METYPVPKVALREALLNAIAHKDYSSGVPIQISVYADKLMVLNNGQLSSGWTVKDLLGKHSSQPFNPDIANAFFRAGLIEAWGRGIEKMHEACRRHGAPEPRITCEEVGLWVNFSFAKASVETQTSQKTPVETPVETPKRTPDQILQQLTKNPNLSLAEVAMAIGRSRSAVERARAKMVKQGRLRFIGPPKGGHGDVLEEVDND